MCPVTNELSRVRSQSRDLGVERRSSQMPARSASLSSLGSGALLFLFLLHSGSSGAATPDWALLNRTNLLEFVSNGQVKRVRSINDWRTRRDSIRAAMQEVMGPLPGNEKRCALDVRIEEENDPGGYLRQFLTYAAEPGGRVPAYLLIPKAALNSRRKIPAVL